MFSNLFNKFVGWALPKLAKPIYIGRKIYIKVLVWLPVIAFIHMVAHLVFGKFAMALGWLAVALIAKTYNEVFKLHRLLKRWGFDQHVPEEEKH